MASIVKRIYCSVFKTFERKDLSAFEHEPDSDLPVYGVYHAFLDKGWESIVETQIESLKRSGLLDYTRKLYVSCVSHGNDGVEKLSRMINSDKVEVISNISDPERYEYPALEFIKALSEREDCLIYYFHTKGISYQAVGTGKDRVFRSFKRKIRAWNRMMEYFVFEKWHVAANALTNGYDIYGCYRWPPRKYTMYSGSFWWGRSSYIKTLPEFNPDIISRDRFYSEVWVYQNSPHDFSAFDTIADLYFVRIPSSIYKGGKPRIMDVLRFTFMYNYRKIQKHFFGYNYKKRCQQRFQNISNTMK